MDDMLSGKYAARLQELTDEVGALYVAIDEAVEALYLLCSEDQMTHVGRCAVEKFIAKRLLRAKRQADGKEVPF